MTVLLVLATFAALILIDYYRSRKVPLQVAAPVQPRAAVPIAPPLPQEIVAGFRVPAHLAFHPGHTWAVRESADLVRVGLDDFTARFAGKLEHVTAPERGRWVRQGQAAFTLKRDGVRLDLASPIEGTVVEVNDAVLRDPELARTDPYGEGWLLLVNAPDAKVSFRNLLHGKLARAWTQESAARLQRELGAPVTAQDGGLAVDDLARLLPDSKWTELAHEFFLT